MLSNCHEAKYAKVNRIMKDGSEEEFECPVAIEFYSKIMGGVDFAGQMANVCGLDRKPCKCGNIIETYCNKPQKRLIVSKRPDYNTNSFKNAPSKLGHNRAYSVSQAKGGLDKWVRVEGRLNCGVLTTTKREETIGRGVPLSHQV
ncbi:rho guanine nucleotide exchange factor 10-like protein [Trichonephila clavata]|uniref:Rho guanine nucleotide exchange factor 10-like protein n=1 Tax=Trichonephila clavata TaxID=2740835 RepID=A0A8X6J820_TRICU|nr:rho guanine nucleotide exchange factor 10-like protein [Trichonephila clavata]